MFGFRPSLDQTVRFVVGRLSADRVRRRFQRKHEGVAMFESITDLADKLAATGYFIDPVMTQVVYLADKLQKPLLLEGPAGPKSGSSFLD